MHIENSIQSKTIVIHPFAKSLRNGKRNPKNYPFWQDLISIIKTTYPEYNIIQIGIEGELQLVEDFRKNLTMNELEKIVVECTTWIGIDSFFQHMAWLRKKNGIVIFGKSDPLIFGHKENINILKDRKYLREHQFWWWEQTEFNEDDFVKPQVILDALSEILNQVK